MDPNSEERPAALPHGVEVQILAVSGPCRIADSRVRQLRPSLRMEIKEQQRLRVGGKRRYVASIRRPAWGPESLGVRQRGNLVRGQIQQLHYYFSRRFTLIQRETAEGQ